MWGPKTGILLNITICFLMLEGQLVYSITDIDIQAVPEDCMAKSCYDLGSGFKYVWGEGKSF